MTVPILLLVATFGGYGQSGAAPAVQEAPELPPPSFAGNAPGQPAVHGTMEDILIELRVGRIAARVVPAFRVHDTPLLPVSPLLEMGEVDFSVEEPGILRAVLHPGSRSVLLHAPDRRARADGSPVPIPANAVIWHRGELFLSAAVLERLFGLRIRTRWDELTATVRNPEALPVGQRLAREARWGAFQRPSDPAPADWRVGMAAHPVGGLVGDWAFSTDLADPEGTTQGSLSLGTRLLGGAVRASSRSVGPLEEGRFETDVSWHLARPDGRVLRQVRLGDALSTGPRPRGIQGAVLTNAPFRRTSEFGVESFQGRLGPGWDVELRRHGQVVDLARADEQGAYALDIPLRFGDNAVQIVAFGPHGEVVTMDRLLLLRQDRLPGGRFEWGLSGGDCSHARCLHSGNLDLRYGISNRWTVRAGVDAFGHDSIAGTVHPYLDLSGALTHSLVVMGEAVLDGLHRGTLHFTPNPHVRARAALTRFDGEAEAPALFDSDRKTSMEADLFVRPVPRWQRWTLRGSLVREEREELTTTRWQALASAQLLDIRWEGGLRGRIRQSQNRERHEELVSVATATGPLPLVRHGPLRPWFRIDVEVLEGAVERARSRIAQSLGRHGRLEVGMDWSQLTGAQLTISLTGELGALRSMTQYRRSPVGPGRVTQVAQGTFQWDEAVGGVNLGPGPGLGRSGLSGFVYFDENGNGRWDPGEPLLGDVQVVVNGRTVRTDEHGRYRIWDLPPFEWARVQIHEPSIPNPTWVPDHRSIEVALPPASYRRLDLRVVPSREISGRVVRPDARGELQGVGGLEVSVVSMETGRTVERLTTFSDGAFYAMGIRPGQYEVRPSHRHLEILELRGHPASIHVQAAGAGAEAADPVIIRLRPADIADLVVGSARGVQARPHL